MNTYFLTVWDATEANGLGKTYNLGRSKGLETPILQCLHLLFVWHANEAKLNPWQYEGNGMFYWDDGGNVARLTVQVTD